MPADRKAHGGGATARPTPLGTSPRARHPAPLERTAPSERPVHGVRQVRELSSDERRRFNSDMYAAIEFDDPRRVERLLEDKVAVSYANGLTTPLHAAARQDRVRIARVLLAFGMDANPTDSMGQTPLAIALERGHEATAEVLREYGGVVTAHPVVERVSEEELDALAGGMSGMGGTGVADELAQLGDTMHDVKMSEEDKAGT